MMLTAAQVATLLGLSESRHFGRKLPHTYGAGVLLLSSVLRALL